MSKIKRVIMIEKTYVSYDLEIVRDAWETIVDYESGSRTRYIGILPHKVEKFISNHVTIFSVSISFNDGRKTYIRKWEEV